MTFVVRKRNRLPHWDVSHGIQFVTWHLADALPIEAVERLRRERDYQRQRLRETRGSVTKADVATIEVTFRRRCEGLLDESCGSCVLRDHRAAKIVADAVTHFDEQRYRLFAWCVMPNHVHAVFSTKRSLAEVLHSWKSYTRTQINGLLHRTGKLWQDDYFDRLMRNEKQFRRAVDYVLNNPVKAGLMDWPFVRSYPERF
ncbi:MAG: transposase [Acidobacteriota bacterium]